MTSLRLVQRGLTYYWRTNVAVVLGVATAVTVLAGALLVGDSVRGSLRDLVLQRLGQADYALLSSDFVREQLADDLRSDLSFASHFGDACPIVVMPGLATNQTTGARSLGVHVYGVDERFWRFHGLPTVPLGSDPDRPDVDPGQTPPLDTTSRDVFLSPALARAINAQEGETILLRIQRPSDIPLDSLHGRKDDVGRTLRLNLRGVLPVAALGEFSLQPQQGEVRAAFVPLARLQEDLDLKGLVNAILVSAREPAAETTSVAATGVGELEALARKHASIEDLGLQVRALDAQGVLSVETRGTLIDGPREEAIVAAAAPSGMPREPVFTYLVNTIGTDRRAIPYSLVTAIDLNAIVPGLPPSAGGVPPIVLNDWAARDLQAGPGDQVTLDYLAWEDPGLLQSRSAIFQVAAIVPMRGLAGDRDLVPAYPGVTGAESLREWDPPFPIDLGRIRPADEDYWRGYRTTPKAFIPLSVGQSLWRSRHGALTSIRVMPPRGTPLGEARAAFVERLRAALDPFALGLAVRDVRGEGIAASRGATDFGAYFTYFSFFLVVSALLLAVLFFKLGVEQRAREVGLLRAVGFTPTGVGRLFVGEALVVSLAGSALGVLGAVGYGALMMAGLRTWWVDAVGTTALTLHVSAASLAAGGVGGVVAAVASIWWTLRALRHVSERSLLAGRVTEDMRARRTGPGTRWTSASATVFLAVGLLLIAAGATGLLVEAGAFFGAGALLLIASLCALASTLRRPPRVPLAGRGWRPLTRLGFRNLSHRPGRSVLAVAVMASATFVLISVGAFRKDAGSTDLDPQSGTGGFAVMVNTLLPLLHDPNSPEGRDLLGLPGATTVGVTPFRVRPGDDASCLNLYEPREPRIVAVGADFIRADRFSFQSSLATSVDDRANPWRLLDAPLARSVDAGGGVDDSDVVPAIADANSMAYVLHKSLGDEVVVSQHGRPMRLRLVAALRDSLFQGELLISEANFLRLFPDQPGYQLLLADTDVVSIPSVVQAMEDRLSDFGADAVPAAERLAEFHKVENTYLSTFQTLGGLGLLLGTLGLATVLLRNVLERRRELALLGAVGYRRSHILTIVIAENAFLLVAGLLVGAACALVAVAPAALQRGGRLPVGTGVGLLLFAVLAGGLLSSLVATRVTIRTRLLHALKAE